MKLWGHLSRKRCFVEQNGENFTCPTRHGAAHQAPRGEILSLRALVLNLVVFRAGNSLKINFFFSLTKKKSRQNEKKFSRKNKSPVKIWGLRSTRLRLQSCLKSQRREFFDCPEETLRAVRHTGHPQAGSRPQKMRDEILLKICLDEKKTFLVKKRSKVPKTVLHLSGYSATWWPKFKIPKKFFKNFRPGASFEVPRSVVRSITKKLEQKKSWKREAVTHPSTDPSRCCLTLRKICHH